MPKIEMLEFKDLQLDLHNYRTVEQRTEAKALHAMVSIRPDRFWALTESLLQDGFHINENIVVLKSGDKGNDPIVREGNRRIAALKLIHGYIPRKDLTIPSHIETLIAAATDEWKAKIKKVPCAVYAPSEAHEVDKIVARTHGKAQEAGRDPWNAVARARHNRDENKASEPSLDLLEAFLKHGQHVTAYQKERWAGDYPLSILDEALKAMAKRVGKATSRELADAYPKITHRDAVESVLHAIGSLTLTFKELRGGTDILAAYGFPPAAASTTTTSGTSTAGGTGGGSAGTTAGAGTAGTTGGSGSAATGGTTTGTGGGAGTGAATGGTTGKSAAGNPNGPRAVASNDPKAVARTLKRFQPIGKDREKVVVLLNEIKKLKLRDHPHAFCFLLRSMFEISAKAYCKNQGKAAGLKTTDNKGMDRKLVEVLRDITKDLVAKDPAMQKVLHGAMAELATATGFLSVVSMNQLIHNPNFVIGEQQIATLFANVFPLLEAMNS